MKNYYILTVDSFQDTFTRIDAGKDFYFELSVQNITGILSVLQGGDTVIVYRKSPVSGCTIVLQVVENAGNKTKFRKVFEIGNVVNPSVPDHDLENEYLVEISSDVYGVICKQMLDSIQGIMEVNISEEEHQNNLKQRFEQYILHVLKLKSTRQVGDLEKLSDRLVANGVLERGVYQIDNIDDYSICHKGDIVVSQDYGVAAMALGKGAYAIYQSGKWYTDENIDQMLMERHLNKKARRGSHKNHIKGPRKRTEEDDVRFAQSFEKMIQTVIQVR